MGNHLGTTDKSVTAKVTFKGPFREMISNVLFEQMSLKKGSSAKLAEIVHAIGVVLSLILEKEFTPFKTRMVNVKGGRRLKLLTRSEEHTSELQSPCNLVCRLLLEKQNTPRSRSGGRRWRECGGYRHFGTVRARTSARARCGAIPRHSRSARRERCSSSA